MEQLTSAIYLEQRPDVEHYLEVMDRSQRRGADPGGHHAPHRAGRPRDMTTPTQKGAPMTA